MTEPIHPDLVNAIVRNPDDPRHPSRITVFCDQCGTENSGEYMVSAEMTSTERLAVARQHLVTNAGWEHTADGDDYCPEHAGSPAEAPPASRPLTVKQLAAMEARAAAATPGPWTVDLEQCDCSGGPCSHGTYVSSVYSGGVLRSEFGDFPDADWQFVIHARADVPALLDEVTRLKSQRRYLIVQLAKRDAESGRGDEAVRKFLAGEQPDEQPAVTITAETAAHVLFLECLGGWPPSTFGTKLLNLWTSADSGNAERLAVSFPEYGAALALLRSGTAGIEQLRAIAGA